MVIPKVLAQNSGFDPQDTTIKLQVGRREEESKALLDIQNFSLACDDGWLSFQEEFVRSGQPVGLDLSTGK